MTDSPNLPRVPLAPRVTEWREATVCRDTSGTLCVWLGPHDGVHLYCGSWEGKANYDGDLWYVIAGIMDWKPENFPWPTCPLPEPGESVRVWIEIEKAI